MFPDGTQATIVYPIPLGLELMGVQPDLAYAFRGRYQGRIVFLSGPRTPRSGDSSIPTGGPTFINSSAGGLELWPDRGDDDHSPGSDSSFRRGRCSSRSRSWVRVVRSSWPVSPQAWPVPSTSVKPPPGSPSSARLEMPSSQRGSARRVGRSWRSATLRPNPTWCPSWTPRSSSRRTDVRPPWIVVLPGGTGRSAFGDGRVFASIYGDREFVASVIDGLRMRICWPT